jgi:hypothetical protein
VRTAEPTKLTIRYQSDRGSRDPELGEHEARENEQRAGDLDELRHERPPVTSKESVLASSS